jgi:hypothetical protein
MKKRTRRRGTRTREDTFLTIAASSRLKRKARRARRAGKVSCKPEANRRFGGAKEKPPESLPGGFATLRGAERL